MPHSLLCIVNCGTIAQSNHHNLPTPTKFADLFTFATYSMDDLAVHPSHVTHTLPSWMGHQAAAVQAKLTAQAQVVERQREKDMNEYKTTIIIFGMWPLCGVSAFINHI